MWLSLFVPCFLTACGGDVSLTKRTFDADSDGYTSDVDCDDEHATVNPDASEVCDGLDNDCDGDETLSVYDCEPPTGYVADSADCDDANAAVHPDAPEADCSDPTDYNCDGSVAYADADGDGVAACEDCDDTNAMRSPDAI